MKHSELARVNAVNMYLCKSFVVSINNGDEI
jgi:hypothetical protein